MAGLPAPEGTELFIVLIITFAALVAADILTKAWLCPLIIKSGNTMKFIPGLLRFEYTQNTGMAWGMFKNSTLFLTIFSICAVLLMVLVVIAKRRTMPKLLKLALIVIAAGAVGNIIDRIALGYVRDFVTFDFMDFPIFNFADVCVTVGTALLVIGFFFTKGGREFYKHLDDNWKKKAGADKAPETEQTPETERTAENTEKQ